MSKTETPEKRTSLWMAAAPFVLMAAMVVILILALPRNLLETDLPPVEELTVGRVTLSPGLIELQVTNGGPSPVTIAQVLVDEAYWQHTVSPGREVPRLGSATVTIAYPWVESEPIGVVLITETGVTFEHTIDVATSSPGMEKWPALALVGVYIGILPVFMGMAWRPLLKKLSSRWLHFFLAFTAGVLIFLGVETLAEALERSGDLPGAFGGTGLVTLATLGSFALAFAAARRLEARSGADRRMVVAMTVAAGIGLHNLGEGLAVGGAYRLGEVALSTFLIAGFAIHNTTEGIGIVAVIGRRNLTISRFLTLGLLAGAPTVVGSVLGGVLFSPAIATVFLSVATGAIAEVVYDVLKVVREDAPGGLASPPALVGIALGLVVMYLTGIFIAV